MQEQFETFINTTHGEKRIEEFKDLKMFGHEYLQHPVSQTQAPDVSLQTLRDHLRNPFNMANTSISQSLMAHELREPAECCVVDCSKAEAIDVLMSKAIILKGYEILVKTNIAESHAKALYDMDTLRKMIEMDFSMNAVQRAFLGQICLEDLNLNNIYVQNSLKVYSEFSLATGCPILMNCISREHPQCLYDSLQSKTYERISKFLELLTDDKVRAKTIIFNPPFSIVCGHQLQSRNINIELVNTSYPAIEQLRAKWKVIIGYDLLRYNDAYALQMIGHEITQFPNNTVLSAGVLFKTDLCSFAGQGYYCPDVRTQLGVSPALLQRCCKTTFLELFNWKRKAKVIVEVKFWKCSKCGKEAEESVPGFKKFNKQFCSVACIKAYNFEAN